MAPKTGYFESEDFKANRAAHRGTLDTTASGPMDHSVVSPEFPKPLTGTEVLEEIKDQYTRDIDIKEGRLEHPEVEVGQQANRDHDYARDVTGASSSQTADSRDPIAQVEAAARSDADGNPPTISGGTGSGVSNGNANPTTPPAGGEDGDAPQAMRAMSAPADGDAEGEFDPNDHGVVEVNEYLAEADEEERERVLAAERAGKNRKTVNGNE